MAAELTDSETSVCRCGEKKPYLVIYEHSEYDDMWFGYLFEPKHAPLIRKFIGLTNETCNNKEEYWFDLKIVYYSQDTIDAFHTLGKGDVERMVQMNREMTAELIDDIEGMVNCSQCWDDGEGWELPGILDWKLGSYSFKCRHNDTVIPV